MIRDVDTDYDVGVEIGVQVNSLDESDSHAEDEIEGGDQDTREDGGFDGN